MQIEKEREREKREREKVRDTEEGTIGCFYNFLFQYTKQESNFNFLSILQHIMLYHNYTFFLYFSISQSLTFLTYRNVLYDYLNSLQNKWILHDTWLLTKQRREVIKTKIAAERVQVVA